VKKYLRIKEASKYFSISPSTIKRWIKLNKITAYKHERIVIVKISDIEKLFNPVQTDYESKDRQIPVNDYVNEIMSELEN